MYAAIGGIAVAIAGVFFSNYYTRQSNKIASSSFDSYKKTSEADLLLRLNENIYRSDEGKRIIECAKNKSPVLEANKGPVTERELENFLNEVESVLLLIEQVTMTSDMAEQGFRWVIERIQEHSEIMTYIKQAQDKYGNIAWKPISDYVPGETTLKTRKSKPGISQKTSLYIAKLQILTTGIVTVGATSFAIGAAMWISALSILGTNNNLEEQSPFLLNVVNVFNQLSPLFTIPGMIAILFGTLYPVFLLRNKKNDEK